MRKKLLLLMLAFPMLTVGCATPSAPGFVQPRLPPPSIESMRPAQPNFQCRMQLFLQGKPIEQIESLCNSEHVNESLPESSTQ